MIKHRLEKHIKLCIRNLRSERVQCCAECPFEDEILRHYPGLTHLFIAKRRVLGMEETEKKTV